MPSEARLRCSSCGRVFFASDLYPVPSEKGGRPILAHLNEGNGAKTVCGVGEPIKPRQPARKPQ